MHLGGDRDTATTRILKKENGHASRSSIGVAPDWRNRRLLGGNYRQGIRLRSRRKHSGRNCRRGLWRLVDATTSDCSRAAISSVKSSRPPSELLFYSCSSASSGKSPNPQDSEFETNLHAAQHAKSRFKRSTWPHVTHLKTAPTSRQKGLPMTTTPVRTRDRRCICCACEHLRHGCNRCRRSTHRQRQHEDRQERHAYDEEC